MAVSPLQAFWVRPPVGDPHCRAGHLSLTGALTPLKCLAAESPWGQEQPPIPVSHTSSGWATAPMFVEK